LDGNRLHGGGPSRAVDDALNAIARGIERIHDAYRGTAYLDSWVDDPWVYGSFAHNRDATREVSTPLEAET
jgi:hypothetical protein